MPEVAGSMKINASAFQQYILTHQSVSLTSRAEAYFPFIIIAYITGMVLQMAIILKGYLIIRKIKSCHLQEIQEEWKIIFKQFVQKLNITRKISFKYSSFANTPMVIGYFKPVILFPASLFTYLDTEQVEALLIHELSHIKRNDYLLNLIKTFIETILFFNPFVWMAGKFILIEREHACDDMVVRLTGKPVIYAHALLQLELSTDKSVPAYTLAATGKSQFLFQRIKRITNMKTNYMNLKQQMAAFTLAIACLISFAWIRPIENRKTKAAEGEIAKTVIQPIPGAHNSKTEVISDTIIDPVQKKAKIKIVVTDNSGNKKEYNSLKELPDSLREDSEIFGNPELLIKNGDSVYFKEFNSKEWKKQQEEIAKQFNSVEWKNQQKELAKKYKEFAFNIEKKFSSPEWKSQQEAFAKKYQDLALTIEKKFNSPEWGKQQQELYEKLSSGKFYFKMDTLYKSLKSQTFKNLFLNQNDTLFQVETGHIKKGLNQIMTDLNNQESEYKLKNNEEYKKLKEKFDRDVEKLKKKEANKSNKENRSE